MKQDSFKIVCDLGIGEGEFTSFGCDLSYEYVKINAEYRTQMGVKRAISLGDIPLKYQKYSLIPTSDGWRP